MAEAACFARDLVNEPGNRMTPTMLARGGAEYGGALRSALPGAGPGGDAENSAWARSWVSRKARVEPPRFVVLEHNGARTDLKPYVVVGKGITFDSGGISIKPSEGMERMKDDMAGAAATLGVLRAVAELSLPIRVIGLVAATENLPGGQGAQAGRRGALTRRAVDRDHQHRC